MNKKKALKLAFFIVSSAAVVTAQTPAGPIEIKARRHAPVRFTVYGDTRFTDPSNTKDANPEVRQTLVRAIAEARPDFIVFDGDIALNGDKPEDWKVFDQETAAWRERRIPVYPALGNHDLHGSANDALTNYFTRFPDLKQNRFYSVRAAFSLILELDSSLDETSGPQGDWLREQIDHIPKHVDFLFIVLHHPPYTSSSDAKTFGGGHSARASEQRLAAFLEEQQKRLRARIVVFGGHVHNYERHEHGGVTYFVTGGGGAHAYPITRAADDPYQSTEINYHYILVEVKKHKLKVTMNRLEMKDGLAKWSTPDSVNIPSPARPPTAPIRGR
jgi:Icc-related predicted phosphoesterase